MTFLPPQYNTALQFRDYLQKTIKIILSYQKTEWSQTDTIMVQNIIGDEEQSPITDTITDVIIAYTISEV